MTCSTTDHHNLLCPLCGAGSPRLFHVDSKREYLQCTRCKLVYVPEQFHLEPESEKSEYDKHCNSPEDTGYRKFLSRLYLPMLERLEPGAAGLDFGCGPGPTLSLMFGEAGFKMNNYDPFYAPDKRVLNIEYGFITATEVVEHLAFPGKEFCRLFNILKIGGILGIMTKQLTEREAFKTWHYIRDLTHISFYSKETFMWIAKRYQADLEFIGSDVVIMRKKTIPLR